MIIKQFENSEFCYKVKYIDENNIQLEVLEYESATGKMFTLPKSHLKEMKWLVQKDNKWEKLNEI